MPKPSGRPAAGPQQVSQEEMKKEFHLYYTGSGYVIHPDTMSGELHILVLVIPLNYPVLILCSATPAPLTQVYSSNTDQHSAVKACSKYANAQTASYPSFQLYKDTTNDQWNCTIFAPTHPGGPSKADFTLMNADVTSVVGYTSKSPETRRRITSQSTECQSSPAVCDYCSTYPQYCQACLENPSACSYCAENPSARICTGGSRRKRRGMVWEQDAPKEVLMELAVMGELGIGRL